MYILLPYGCAILRELVAGHPGGGTSRKHHLSGETEPTHSPPLAGGAGGGGKYSPGNVKPCEPPQQRRGFTQVNYR